MEKTTKTIPSTSPMWRQAVEAFKKSLVEKRLPIFKEELRKRLRQKMKRGDFGPEAQKKALQREEDLRLMDLLFERMRSRLH